MNHIYADTIMSTRCTLSTSSQGRRLFFPSCERDMKHACIRSPSYNQQPNDCCQNLSLTQARTPEERVSLRCKKKKKKKDCRVIQASTERAAERRPGTQPHRRSLIFHFYRVRTSVRYLQTVAVALNDSSCFQWNKTQQVFPSKSKQIFEF